MAETIDRKLNLVLTYPRDKGALYVHATAISKQVFETYYRVISKAFASIYTDYGGASGAFASGPRIAALELKRAAAEFGGESAKADVEQGLMAEIRRLANAILLTDKGWETLPLGEVIKRGLLDEDEASEVENALAFFTVASRMHRKQELTGVLGVMSDLWGAQIVSSNCTAYAASLEIPSQADVTTKKAAA